jgi:hypothetical protein
MLLQSNGRQRRLARPAVKQADDDVQHDRLRCLTGRNCSRSEFQPDFVEPEKWFRCRALWNGLLRRAGPLVLFLEGVSKKEPSLATGLKFRKNITKVRRFADASCAVMALHSKLARAR